MIRKEKFQKRAIRHKRVRAVIKGTSDRPRLSVFRSGKRIYAQLIDDAKGNTVLNADDGKEVRSKKLESGNKDKLNRGEERAFLVGETLAKRALKKGIKAAVFDRGGYKYHGQVKALAEGARKGGLKF